jgi:hypothetical protein
MTTLPVANRFSDGTLTNAQAKAAQNDMLAAMREMLGGEAVTTLTIASGVVTPTRAVHLVDTESSSASDDLDRISNVNHPDGRVVIIGTVDAARDVTVRHGLATSGNNLRILLAGGVDLVLSDPSMRLVLQRRGTDWVELDRSYGSQSAAERTAIGAAASGAVTASGLTMATARFLGRTSASTGAIEELDATAVRNALASAWKDPVRVATTANLASLSGTQTIDGVSVAAGERVLVKDQTTASANGIYVCASGSWSRAADADAWAELPGAVVAVMQGTVNADQVYLCTSNPGGTLGTTAVTWAQVGGMTQVGGSVSLAGAQVEITGIPSWARRVILFLAALSSSGTGTPILGLGSSAGIETGGYSGGTVTLGTTNAQTTSASAMPLIAAGGAAANSYNGRIVLERWSTDSWIITGQIGENGGSVSLVEYRKNLAGALDRVRFSLTGVDVYDGSAFVALFVEP